MALINAKNGMAAVGLAIAAATAVSQGISALVAKRQGDAVARGLKPGQDAVSKELLSLREQVETTQQQLLKA